MVKSQTGFDEESYVEIVETALNYGYTVGTVAEALTLPPKALVLRHDVDYSLERAVALATLEHKLGVRSTYYIMVSNALYNPRSAYGRSLIGRIVDLGHEIGLHWDSSLYPADPAEATRQFKLEIGMIEAVTGVPVRSASQHTPAITASFDFADLVEVDAYSKAVIERYRYVSDSCMRWRESTPLDLLRGGVDTYFLSHPLWWTTPGASQFSKIQHTLIEAQARLGVEIADMMDTVSDLIVRRQELDQGFKERMGWSEPAGDPGHSGSNA